MLNRFIIAFIFLHLFTYSYSQSENDWIIKNMMAQQESWNKGDIEGFMKYYWHSDSLQFIGKSITYGWKNTLENYKKSYPDSDAMGTLSFDIKHVEVYNHNTAYVIGKWTLKKKTGKDAGGYYTLLWKKINQEWVIVIDHTS